jgi:hypothetical protein
MEEKIIMSQKEIKRINVLNKVLEGKMRQIQAAKLLNLSAKQVNRIIIKARQSSLVEALVHKNRGKRSAKKIRKQVEEYIVKLFTSIYSDFSVQFFLEKLKEEHEIILGKETIRKILNKYSARQPRQRKSTYCHIWRERKHHEGELIQVDGSHHKWLEDRYPNELCLTAYIDDATGRVYAKFYDHEGTKPALDSLKNFVILNEIPKALYLDRHSTYITTRQASIDEQLRNKQPKTQFERACHELGIKAIHARSPQAKGRVERLFATLQDRLVKELRLADISTLAEANVFLEKYLIKFNKQFSIKPKENASFFTRIPTHINLNWICAIKDIRTICSDYTINWNTRLFLLLNPVPRLRRRRIEVRELLNGTLKFIDKNSILRVKEITDKDIKRAKLNKSKLERIAKYWKENEENFIDYKYVELSLAK